MPDTNVKEVVWLMDAFAERTGLTSDQHPQPYPWTDALAGIGWPPTPVACCGHGTSRRPGADGPRKNAATS